MMKQSQSQVLNRSYHTWPPPLPPGTVNRSHWKPHHRSNKHRRFFHKKKHHCFTPHNTTSFLIRAKKSGGIASLVSPCPVTPAVLPTPEFSPAREVLADVAREEWGVDGYGSMNGLIRVRPIEGDDESEGVIVSCDDDDEEVEKRLSHDLTRFEMICDPCNCVSGRVGCGFGGYRVDDVEEHIERLEEENMELKEKIYVMGSELEELRRRVRFLEGDDENGSDNEPVSEKSVGDN